MISTQLSITFIEEEKVFSLEKLLLINLSMWLCCSEGRGGEATSCEGQKTNARLEERTLRAVGEMRAVGLPGDLVGREVKKRSI